MYWRRESGLFVCFQGIAVFKIYATVTILLAEYILVALNDYSLLMYVQDSSNFPCSGQKKFLEAFKKLCSILFLVFQEFPEFY